MKGRTLKIHIAIWMGLYVLWLLLFQNHAITLSRTMTVEFCYLIFITAAFYIISYYCIPKFLYTKQYASFVVSIVLVILGSSGLRSFVALAMNQFVYRSHIGFSDLLLNSVINISFWVALAVAGKTFYDRISTQRQMEVLEREKTRNELNFLKAQINPHSLFNSLNTIYGHIDKKNAVARDILIKFSGLLRYQLYDCTSDKVALQKEMDYIENYVAFQRLRKDDSLIVKLCVEPVAESLTIPPLLLIGLVENAFKYVSSFPDKENDIFICLKTSGTVFEAEISNSIDERTAPRNGGSGGIGITNLTRRLEILYPGKFEFSGTRNSDRYNAYLKIDLI